MSSVLIYILDIRRRGEGPVPVAARSGDHMHYHQQTPGARGVSLHASIDGRSVAGGVDDGGAVNSESRVGGSDKGGAWVKRGKPYCGRINNNIPFLCNGKCTQICCSLDRGCELWCAYPVALAAARPAASVIATAVAGTGAAVGLLLLLPILGTYSGRGTASRAVSFSRSRTLSTSSFCNFTEEKCSLKCLSRKSEPIRRTSESHTPLRKSEPIRRTSESHTPL